MIREESFLEQCGTVIQWNWNQITIAKTYVFSDSVLCVGKMGDDLVATWKSKIEWYSENNHFKDMNRIDGMPTGVRVETFPRNHNIGHPREDSKSNERPTVWTWALQRQDHLHVNVQWHCMERKEGNTERCGYNSQTVADYACKFPRGHDKPGGSFGQIAENMMTIFSESDHPIFRVSSDFEEQRTWPEVYTLQQYRWKHRVASPHGDLCESAPDLCNEFCEDFRASVKLEAPDHLETMEIPTVSSIAETHTYAQQRRNLVQEYERKLEHLSEDQKCSGAGLQLVQKRTILQNSGYRRRTRDATFMPRIHNASQWQRIRIRGWILKNTRIVPVMDVKVRRHEDRYSIAFWSNLFFKTTPYRGSELWTALMSTWQNRC